MSAMQPMMTVALGFTLGLSHALDPDHLVAVSTLVSTQPTLRRASLVGTLWGLGHTTTLFLVGLFVVGFKVAIPSYLALSMECVVGIVLVSLGVSVLGGHLRRPVHAHEHIHREILHRHFHSYTVGEGHDHTHSVRRLRTSFLVGTVHGLAGSAALMLLVLTTIRTPILAMLYILLFGVGSLAGMLSIGTAIAVPFRMAKRSRYLRTGLQILTGGASVAYGILVLVRVGIGEGFFRF